jgi:hypothetical protein
VNTSNLEICNQFPDDDLRFIIPALTAEELVVHLLRAETREMLMYNLDRSLAILMWRYYKETHQAATSSRMMTSDSSFRP